MRWRNARRARGALVAAALALLATAALADARNAGSAKAGAATGADAERQPQAPLDPELAGRIDRAVTKAMEGLRGLEALESLRALESLESLQGLAKLDELDVFPDLDDAGDQAQRGDAAGEGATIDEHRPLNADGRIAINNVAGTIQVSSWDRNEVAIGGVLGSSAAKLEISGDNASLAVTVRLPKHAHFAADSVLKLRVPAEARVEIDSVSADIAVDGLRGPVRVNTVSGDIRLALNSPEIAVQTVSGDLKLRAPARQTRVSSVSGDLHLAGLQGRLGVETVSGNVDLEGGKFSELRLKSISGDMRLDVALAEDARIAGETLSGEITMLVPVGTTGTALLKSFSGEASCEGAHAVDAKGQRKREYAWGDGRGARIELSSFSGDIRVQKH